MLRDGGGGGFTDKLFKHTICIGCNPQMKSAKGGYDGKKIKCSHCGGKDLALREIVKASEKEIGIEFVISLSSRHLGYRALYYCKNCKGISSYPA